MLTFASKKPLVCRTREHTNSQPVLSSKVSIATSEGQAAYTGVVDGSSYGCKTIFCCFDIDIFPDRTAFNSDGFSLRIYGDFAHLGEIDNDAILDRRSTRSGMTSTTNRERYTMLAYLRERCRYIVRSSDFDNSSLVLY